jgi:hypothetical protein
MLCSGVRFGDNPAKQISPPLASPHSVGQVPPIRGEVSITWFCIGWLLNPRAKAQGNSLPEIRINPNPETLKQLIVGSQQLTKNQEPGTKNPELISLKQKSNS